MKRGLLDRIDRCSHVVAAPHTPAGGSPGLKLLALVAFTIIAGRDGIAAGNAA